MTTKELFEALLAGKKIWLKHWEDKSANGKYYYMNESGQLMCHNPDYKEELKVNNLFIEENSEVDWHWQEYKEEILTDKEKEYLSAVIKPFRDRVSYIVKERYINCCAFIYICADKHCVWLPSFETNTMYKGMKLDEKYTLEELGL